MGKKLFKRQKKKHRQIRIDKQKRYSVRFSLYKENNFREVYRTNKYEAAMEYAMELCKVVSKSGVGFIILKDNLLNSETCFSINGPLLDVYPRNLREVKAV